MCFGSEGWFIWGIRIVFSAIEITDLGERVGLWNWLLPEMRSKGPKS